MRTAAVENETGYDWRRDGWLAACALTAVLLIVSAATPHAPGFDTFLRTFVFCLALVRGFAGFRRDGAWLPLSAAVIAILFNPARPIEMSRVAWIWCDLIAAAWFAVVGAWQLLRSWEPQRGWAAAALSLGAVAVPAVASMTMPNRDRLTPANLDENLAIMNADANTAAPAPTANAGDTAISPPATSPAPPAAPRASRPIMHPSRGSDVTNETSASAKDRPRSTQVEESTQNDSHAEPPPSSTAPDSATGEAVNNESSGNSE